MSLPVPTPVFRTRSGSASSSVKGFDNLDAYVKALGGTHPIKKVLIANNGIAAVKCIRFLRKWAYEVFSNEKEVCLLFKQRG